MATSDLLVYAAGVLDRLGLRYFVTGSMATISYGEPRFTNDIDIVVDLPLGKIGALCASFPEPEYYVSEESAQRAVRNQSQFNIIQPSAGLKIDVMIPERSAFNEGLFRRVRRLEPVNGIQVNFASPEDAILMKLVYYRDGGSDKHLRDISGILKIGAGSLDLDLIAYWTEELEVAETWRELISFK